MHKFVINIVLILILGIMSLSLYNVLNSRSQEDSSIKKLANLYNSEKSLNQKLSSDYTYYNSSEYIEKVSRDNLNLAPSGEYIVVLPSSIIQSRGGEKTTNSQSGLSNISQWFDLLFH